jgi:large subunit ribosomal protein L29
MTKQADSLIELRQMTVAELDDHLRKQRRRLFEVRFQQATGQVENHRQVREIRHEIARALTVKIETERGLRPEPAPAPAAAPAPKPTRTRASKPAPAPVVAAVAEADEPGDTVAAVAVEDEAPGETVADAVEDAADDDEEEVDE